LQQDEEPTHYAANMYTFLNNRFPLWARWHGSLIWSPIGSDLIIWDNWLWPFVKEQLSPICMYSVAKLEGEIHYTFNTITPVMLQWASWHTWQWVELHVNDDSTYMVSGAASVNSITCNDISCHVPYSLLLCNAFYTIWLWILVVLAEDDIIQACESAGSSIMNCSCINFKAEKFHKESRFDASSDTVL
jgi:hypothetical protein